MVTIETGLPSSSPSVILCRLASYKLLFTNVSSALHSHPNIKMKFNNEEFKTQRTWLIYSIVYNQRRVIMQNIHTFLTNFSVFNLGYFSGVKVTFQIDYLKKVLFHFKINEI